jgi:hypothetical protein
MEKEKYPDFPVFEENSYEKDADVLAEAERKRTEQMEKKARRDRDMAIIGDLAGLFAQGAAMHGGAYMTGRTESATAQANERLRKIQESNSKQLAEYARQQMVARDNARKERNAMKKAQYDAQVAGVERDFQQAKLDETIRSNQENEKIKALREDRLRNQQSKAVSKVLEAKKIVVGGKTYSEVEHGPYYLMRAYVENGSPKITRKVHKRNEIGGYEYDNNGDPVYVEIEVSNPTQAEIAQALVDADYDRMQGFDLTQRGNGKQAGFIKNGKTAGFKN